MSVSVIQEEFKEKKNKVVVKVGMLGDSQIGKTTLMVKYIEDKYDEDYIETLGVNFMEKTIELKNVNVTISIWDLGGQREFATLMPLVCSDAKVILFAFDLTQKQSLFSVKRWYKEARKENKVNYVAHILYIYIVYIYTYIIIYLYTDIYAIFNWNKI